MSEISTSSVQADQYPTTAVGWGYKIAHDFGIASIFAIVLGLASKQMYEDIKQSNDARYAEARGYQSEMFDYLKGRNESELKRAMSDAQLATSLQSLSAAIERIATEVKTAHTKPTP